MKPEKQISDEQLDALLREVETPASLKDQLHKIPQLSSESHRTSKPENNSSRWLTLGNLALAASVLAITGFVTWMLLGTDNDSGERVVDKQPGTNSERNSTDADTERTDPNETNLAEDTDAESSGSSSMTIAAQHQQLDELIREVELQSLRGQVARMNTEVQRTFLDPNDYESMIFALADQSAVELGGSESRVLIDMVNVIERYPNTRGAKIAQQFIDTRARQPN